MNDQTDTTMTAPSGAASQHRHGSQPWRLVGGSLRAAWLLLRLGVLAGAIAMLVAWHHYGYMPVAVQSGSMTPTYPVHTLLFDHHVAASKVRVGDVITFDPPGRVPRTTHRVVARYTHLGQVYFRTKGDANPAPDDWRVAMPAGVPDEPYMHGVTYANGTALRVEGHIPRLGYLTQLDRVPHLRMLLLLAPFLLVGLQLLSWIWGSGESPAPETARRDDLDDDATEADLAA